MVRQTKPYRGSQSVVSTSKSTTSSGSREVRRGCFQHCKRVRVVYKYRTLVQTHDRTDCALQQLQDVTLTCSSIVRLGLVTLASVCICEPHTHIQVYVCGDANKYICVRACTYVYAYAHESSIVNTYSYMRACAYVSVYGTTLNRKQ